MAKKQFKAESKRLLDLMINSIYTHQEIFLREIISNASDAIDKLAYLALTDENVGLSRSDFAIQLKPDETARTLTVSDNGIGMDKDEMENNLGTICRSGSLQFKQTLDKDKAADTDIIGQFGVGFYSAFMVADKVTVISKKYGSDEAWKWESEGADGYTMTPCERANAGTDVIMQLKADTDDEKYSRFLKTWELQQLVRKYSDYIRYPIRMEVEKSRMKEGTEKDEKPEYETYTEVETLNSMVPIWNKNKKDVTDEEYNNFYKEKFFDFEDPLAVIHANVEGAVTYKALLYIPAKAPYDFYTKDFKRGFCERRRFPQLQRALHVRGKKRLCAKLIGIVDRYQFDPSVAFLHIFGKHRSHRSNTRLRQGEYFRKLFGCHRAAGCKKHGLQRCLQCGIIHLFSLISCKYSSFLSFNSTILPAFTSSSRARNVAIISARDEQS